jgi:hypothetical protein
MFRRLRYLSLALLPGLLFVGYLNLHQVSRPDSIPSVPIAQLGLAPDHAAKAELVAQGLPPFLIVGADGQDNSKRNVRLWDDVIAVNGEHLPNIAQLIGDCVSFGTAHAIEYLQCVQSNRGPPAGGYHPVSTMFLYGASRVTIGSEHGSHFSGDGSVGAYAAEAANKLGVLPSDNPKCPTYNAANARDWGRRGPPQWALDAASSFKVQTVAQMKTTDDVRDAICNGYPVTICSQFGTNTIRPQDGRMVAKHDASWGHCMCIVGYDGSGRQPYWYVLNSWGPDAHPAPLQGEPPGGFWIDQKTLAYIVDPRKSGDCWAFSSFVGFPAQDLDLSPLRPRKVMRPVPVEHRKRAVNPFQVAQRPFQGSKS